MKRLRLAVDARDLARDRRGIGRYARSIVRRLLARDDVDVTLLVNGPFGFRRRAELAHALEAKGFRIDTRVPRDAHVVWHPFNGTFFASKACSVVTIHDVAPFRFPAPGAAEREHQQRPFRQSAATLERAIAVSQFGRDEMHAVLGVPLDRITVIYHGVDPVFSPGAAVAGSVKEPHGYLLFVGDPREPRKNFSTLAEAYRRAWPAGDGPRLAVTGAAAPDLPGAIALGVRNDDAMAHVYRNAVALALPAFYEAFGMPLVEAMACGTPAIASRASCLPEIGGDAPVFVDAHDIAAWSLQLRAVASDALVRDRARLAGIARAATYDWDRSTQAHVAVFSEAAVNFQKAARAARSAGAGPAT